MAGDGAGHCRISGDSCSMGGELVDKGHSGSAAGTIWIGPAGSRGLVIGQQGAGEMRRMQGS